MVRKVEMVPNWGVKLGGGDSGSVPIEASFESGLGFTYILHLTNSASDKIYNIRSGAGDVPLGVMRSASGGTLESIAFVDVYIANDASVGCTFEGAMLNGRRMVSKGGDFSTNDEILEVAGASECHDGSVRNGL